MANERTIAIKINADGTVALAELDKVNNKLNDQPSTLQKLKGHWLEVAAVTTAALVSIREAWDLAEGAAQYQEQMASLDALARHYGTTADQITASVMQASNGLINMVDAASVSAKGLMMGLNPDQLVKFMQIAEATSKVTGQSVKEAFESLTQAAASGNERSLKNMGVIVDLQEAYKKYAASIGTVPEKLSQHGQQQAAVNAILEKGGKIMKDLGDGSISTADKMGQFMVMLQNLKLIAGQVIIALAAGVTSAFSFIGSFVNETLAVLLKIPEAVGWIMSKIPGLKGAGETVKDFFRDMSENSEKAADEGLKNAKIAFDAILGSFKTTQDTVKKGPGITPPTESDVKTDPNKDLQDRLDAEAAYYQKLDELAAMYDMDNQGHFDSQMAAFDAMETAKLNAASMSGASIDQIQRAFANMEMDRQKMILEDFKRKEQQKQALAQLTISAMSGILNDLVTINYNHSKKTAEDQKKAARMQAIINTAAGITKAFATKGWAGIYEALLIAAAGAVQIAKINSTDYGGGGDNSDSGLNSGGGDTSSSSDSSSSTTNTNTPSSPAINIHIYGNVVDHDKFARELIPSLTKAYQDGVQ